VEELMAGVEALEERACFAGVGVVVPEFGFDPV
jgi:hypothetical protein